MKDKNTIIVDNVEKLETVISRVRKAQEVFATYTQEQVDKIFLAAATAANKEKISWQNRLWKRQEWESLKIR